MSASSSDARADPGVRRAAEMLGEAARSGVACDPPAPLFEAHGLAGAYAVQSLLAEAAAAARRRAVGRKIRLTSAAVKAQPGAAQPAFGPHFAHLGYGDGKEDPLYSPRHPPMHA